jgi:histone H3/H4
MTNKINIPASMCKKMLGAKGLRVQPDSSKEFDKMLRNWANNVCELITKKVINDKRKTIMPADLSCILTTVVMHDSDEDEEEEIEDD